MRNLNHGPTGSVILQGPINQIFIECVQCSSRFIQQHNLGWAQKGSGDGETLSLTAGEGDSGSTISQDCIETVW